MQRRKALPGIITLAAKDKNPTSDSKSAYSVESLLSIVVTPSCARLSFIGGRRASITIELSSMPKNSAVIPKVLFFLLIENLSSLQRLLKSSPYPT